MNTTASAVLASWPLDGRVIALLLLTALVYLRGWVRSRGEFAQLACFLGGLIVLFFALESPLDVFGLLFLSAHMTQHLLLLMVVPPLLILGRPAAPFLRGLPRIFVRDGLGPFLAWPALSRALGRFTWPPVAWLAFATSTIGWHLPRAYELALASPLWHGAQHACFFWTGVLFWWPVLETHSRRTSWPRWTMLPYLLLADILNTALSAFLVFSDRVLYPTYEMLHVSNALRDQAAAGVIMWVPGSIVYIVPAIGIAMRLFSTSTPVKRRRAAPQLVQIRRPRSMAWQRRLPMIRRAAQVAMLLLAIVVMGDGFFGTPAAPLNLAGTLPWIHWRALSVLALLVAGNLFCMVCPFTLARDMGRNFVAANLSWPHWLRNKWLPAGLLLIYLWSYEAYSLWDRPALTAWIIAGYFAAAAAIDGMFRGANFCKYVCPIGQFNFLGSLVSPAEIRVRSTDVCRSCETYDCIRGNERYRGCELHLFQPHKQGNMDCTFCLDCVSACPHENVGLMRAGGMRSTLEKVSKRTDVTVLAALFVFGAFVNAAGMVAPVMRWEHAVHAWLNPAPMPAIIAAFVVAGTVVLPGMAVWMCAVLSRARPKLIRGFVFALVPLGLAMWAAHVLYHEVTSRTMVPDWLVPAQLLLLDAGLLLMIYLSWHIGLKYGRNIRDAIRIAVPWAMLGAVVYAIGVWILFQPMQMRGAMQ